MAIEIMLTKRTFIHCLKHYQTTMWKIHEIVKKITQKTNALSKKRSFQKMLFDSSVLLNLRLRMQPRSVTVKKMAGIFTKRIRRPYYWEQLRNTTCVIFHFYVLEPSVTIRLKKFYSKQTVIIKSFTGGFPLPNSYLQSTI